jgi:hypothetical protein
MSKAWESCCAWLLDSKRNGELSIVKSFDNKQNVKNQSDDDEFSE